MELPCNGPCRKWFHPATVNLEPTIANFLLASCCRLSGLLWFCTECRQSATLQYYGTDLPTELLIMIFQHLDEDSLLQVRLTCHRWKQIVDQNHYLRKTFLVSFRGKTTMDECFRPENLFPAARTTFFESKVICVDAWWPSFGTALTELELYGCEIGLPVLLGMLRKTPSLTRLQLERVKYSSLEEVEADFRLEKLESLSCTLVFDVFGSIFPKLKKLDLVYKLEVDQQAKACRLMRSVQGSLKELKCYLTLFIVQQIASMDQLQLTNVTDHGDEDVAVQLSLLQPMIKAFCVTATNETLIKIGQHLKGLEEISVTIADGQGFFEPSFLVKMPQLSFLTLLGQDRQYFSFEGFKSAKLRNLDLDSIYFVDSSLRLFLKSCPNLQKVNIEDCVLGSWSDIFAGRWKSLRSLKLCNIRVQQFFTRISKKPNILKELDISECLIPTENLTELILRCTRLEKLTLDSMRSVDDTFVSNLAQIPQLKELYISDCPITDNSVEFIVDNCPHLRVTIQCEQVSSVAEKLLYHVTRSR